MIGVPPKYAHGGGTGGTGVTTTHRLVNGDARYLGVVPDESVHLVVTSPPYLNPEQYVDVPGQLGHLDDYETFLNHLNQVWAEYLRNLEPGVRVCCVVGDISVPRKRYGGTAYCR